MSYISVSNSDSTAFTEFHSVLAKVQSVKEIDRLIVDFISPEVSLPHN